jgi:hypothetical protein
VKLRIASNLDQSCMQMQECEIRSNENIERCPAGRSVCIAAFHGKQFTAYLVLSETYRKLESTRERSCCIKQIDMDPVPSHLVATESMAEVCASCRNLSIKSPVPVKGCLCCEVVEHGRRLFETCLSSHSRCKSPKSTTLPPRVLDVGEAGEACDPYLYVPSTLHYPTAGARIQERSSQQPIPISQNDGQAYHYNLCLPH